MTFHVICGANEMTKQDLELNRWIDANTKTMLLNSQTDLLSTINQIVREAVKFSKTKTTDGGIQKAKWMLK